MNINDFGNILTNVSTAFSIIAFVVALLRLRLVHSYVIPILLLVIIAFIVELINFAFVIDNENNLYIFHAYTIIEFTLISFFYLLFYRPYFKSYFMLILNLVFCVIAYLDYTVNGLESIDNYSISCESIILTFYALVSFLFIIKNLIFENLLASTFFWINAAVLFYFSGNLLLFAFSNYLKNNNLDEYYVLWTMIHSFLNIFFNTFICIGFWKLKAK